MKNIPESTYKELEFLKVCSHIAEYLQNSESEVQRSFENQEEIIQELNAVSEYLSSFENENQIVFNTFDTIREELQRMTIENYVLSVDSFMKIKKLTQSFSQLSKSILKFEEYYPTLFEWISATHVEKQIVKKIDAVFTKFGEVKNNASEHLAAIRSEIQIQQKKYQSQFSKSLIQYQKMNVLNEIVESEFDGSRVLAVNATFKNRVKGAVRGTSKTGSIIFMEPDSVRKTSKELQILKEEEKKEIRKILQKLTFEISEYQPLLETYQTLLLEMDRVQAKAHYAHEIEACLPQITPSKKIELIQAYHPLLRKNLREGETIIPQNIEMNENQRIIAISGPNAGGKSITLKTIGLLQLMIQNGILVPVNPKSSMSFFGSVLTDIGDNQSIENHLSTYSSRLQRMSKILPKADDDTLILIDEFGTGSDPELGGALAETMLEYLYVQKSFCVVTTHYPNIKLKVENLVHAVNASMLFNKETLSPLYKLEVGQPGSSFTFEVAEKNSIPRKIIEIAKGKLKKDSQNLEDTLVRIQQERFEVEQLRNQLEKNSTQSQQKKENIKDAEQKLLDKLADFRTLYDQEQKTLSMGQRLQELIEKYTEGTSKKYIMQEFHKILEQEKLKNLQTENKSSKKSIRKIKRKMQNDLDRKEEKITQNVVEKKESKRMAIQEGMRVKIKGSTTVGTVDKVEKEKATINYGNFRTNISIFELEKV